MFLRKKKIELFSNKIFKQNECKFNSGVNLLCINIIENCEIKRDGQTNG